jgi:hypothetical protein
MSRRRGNPTCPVPGSPCLLARDDLLVELARVRAREERRPGVPCSNCGERNRVALGGSSRCYDCTVTHEEEGDHLAGSGSGPAVLPGNPNLNRISGEGERILRSVLRSHLCTPCRDGYALRVGIFLGRLEADP